MEGTLVYIMGPSGSGKDSLIAYLRRAANKPYALTWNASVRAQRRLCPLFFARRYITRPAAAGGERHFSLSREAFQFRKDKGLFALDWTSHGLRYGIDTDINDRLAEGAVVVVNGSREYLPQALQRYPALVPVLVTARPEILRSRLEQRGREGAEDVRERLSGASMKLPDLPGLITVDNSGPLEESGRAVAHLFTTIRTVRPC